jgi:hypothetical protein
MSKLFASSLLAKVSGAACRTIAKKSRPRISVQFQVSTPAKVRTREQKSVR